MLHLGKEGRGGEGDGPVHTDDRKEADFIAKWPLGVKNETEAQKYKFIEII